MISYINKFTIALTTKPTEIKTDNTTTLMVPKNYLVLYTERDKLDFSAFDTDLFLPISSDLVRDYIAFIKYDFFKNYNRGGIKKIYSHVITKRQSYSELQFTTVKWINQELSTRNLLTH